MDPSQQTSIASNAGVRRRLDRSCMVCHRRKVRCDKKIPCANCVRAGVLCHFPSTDRPEPRKSRTTISDIASRLGQLERTITAIASSDYSLKNEDSVQDRSQSPHAPSPSQDGASDSPATGENSSSSGLLVQDGYSSQYVNEVLLSRVLEEEEGIREILTTPRDTSDEGSSPSTFNRAPQPVGLLSVLSMQPTSVSLAHALHPTRGQASQLWQSFLQSADPHSKVLHIPTSQKIVYEAISAPEKASAEVQCLLFAVYFAGVNVLPPEAVRSILDKDKQKAMDGFRQGLDICLAAANVFGNPTIMGLQALSIFLMMFRNQNHGRSFWVLSGVAMRVAHFLGLHRDPSSFPGVSPFEAELRRRLWWHLVTLEGRTAEDSGLALNTMEAATNTRFPLVVDDSALDPAMEALPTPPPEGVWTEMTLAVILFDCAATLRQLFSVASPVSEGPLIGDSRPRIIPSEARRREIVEALRSRIESRISGCHHAIPLQRLTMKLGRMLVLKAEFVTRQAWQQMRDSGDDPNTTKEPSARRGLPTSRAYLTDAVTILELYYTLETDELLPNFRVMSESFPQTHALLYVLWHLWVRPDEDDGIDPERAWRAAEYAYSVEEVRIQRRVQAGTDADPGPKWRVLKALKDKLMRARQMKSHQKSTESETAASGPESKARAEEGIDNEVVMSSDGTALDIDQMFNDELGWGGEFMDWKSLAEDLAVHH